MNRRLRSILVVATAVAVTTVVVPAAPAAAESEIICVGSPVPTGWIHTNSLPTPFICGFGNVPLGVITQWEITNISQAKKDDIFSMCIDTGIPVPTGWVEVSRAVVWFVCGYLFPGPNAAPNVRLIKCLNCPVRPPDPPAPTPVRGGFDGVSNTGSVVGWAQDTGRLGTSLNIHYYVDGPAGNGVFAGEGLADVRRDDIQPGNHGMRFTLPAQWFDGRMHTIYAYAIDATGDPPALVSGSPRLFILPKQPIGFLEQIEPTGNAVGWTLDPSLFGYGNVNNVDFYIDGFFVARVPANAPRPDVNTGLGYPADHGYRWPTPQEFRDGVEHTLAARATDLTGDEPRELPGSPKRFTLQRRTAAVDIDGDYRSDVAVWRPDTGVWWYRPSGNPSGHIAVAFGQSGDKPLPGDFDGDRRTDQAVFRSGIWYLQLSTGGFQAVSFGLPGDKPVPGDYDGDGKTDIAVFRPSDTMWYIMPSTGNGDWYGVRYGISTDRPVPGDYDGDGKTDVAVYRPLFGAWLVHQSSNNQDTSVQFGLSSDRVVPADYDGDGRTDIAVFRPSNGTWHILQSLDGRYRAESYGLSSDQVAPADYDGDGRADLAVFRPGTGTWYVRQSRDGADLITQFGSPGDIAVAGVLFE
ncbi:MAG TPA: VCBS repeat-containing protein [Candidatus Limnocylindrales bacterium]|nr:VCBS repeat-containing protein [Candidatus Limnocylindrales bacterium]